MKITINVECTPEEARAFLGLPDVGPMQARMLKEIEAQMLAAAKAMAPEEMLKTWMAGGSAEAMAGWQKAFWDQFGGTKK